MPVDKDPKLGLYIDALKEWVPAARMRLGEWCSVCREDPVLLWHTPPIRYGTYLFGALMAVWILSGTIELFAPGGSTPIPLSRTADFKVVCANPSCGHEFVIRREFGFDDFPVPCPKCKQLTGQRGRRCFSSTCKGAWVAPREVDGIMRCPKCSTALPDGG